MPRRKPRDLFEALWSEVRTTLRQEKLAKAAAKSAAPELSVYHPSTWDTAGHVKIVHVSADGTQTAVGLYEVLLHKRPEAVRYVRAPADFQPVQDSVPVIHVTGQAWLDHEFRQPDQTTESERAAVASYYAEQLHRKTLVEVVVDQRNRRLEAERLVLMRRTRQSMRRLKHVKARPLPDANSLFDDLLKL